MPAVLFVCTANRFRSPMAVAIFHKMLKENGKLDGWRVDSAGTWALAGLPVIPAAHQAARRLGLNLSDHVTSQVSAEMFSEYDLILVMEAGHREALCTEFPSVRNKIHQLSDLIDNVNYDIPDPLINIDSSVDVVFELNDLIQRGYQKICETAESLNRSHFRPTRKSNGDKKRSN